MMHSFLVLVWYMVFPSIFCGKLALQLVPFQDLKKKTKKKKRGNI